MTRRMDEHDTTASNQLERRRTQRRRPIPRRESDRVWTAAPRVLVVAAPVNTRLVYVGLLEEAGYAVYGAADAIEALQATAWRLPDALVISPNSAAPDSIALVEALRADLLTVDVPAVIVSDARVRSGMGSGNRGRYSGATLLLREPVSADAVVSAVDDLIRAAAPDNTARRQLRRALLAIRPSSAGDATADPGAGEIRALIDRLHPGLLGFDARGDCVAVSRGAEALTGYARGELLGRSVFDGTLGPNLPFAALWQEHTAGRPASGTVTIRDKAARSLQVGVQIETLIPGLSGVALTPVPSAG